VFKLNSRETLKNLCPMPLKGHLTVPVQMSFSESLHLL